MFSIVHDFVGYGKKSTHSCTDLDDGKVAFCHCAGSRSPYDLTALRSWLERTRNKDELDRIKNIGCKDIRVARFLGVNYFQIGLEPRHTPVAIEDFLSRLGK